jgi:hypothetical protein
MKVGDWAGWLCRVIGLCGEALHFLFAISTLIVAILVLVELYFRIINFLYSHQISRFYPIFLAVAALATGLNRCAFLLY